MTSAFNLLDEPWLPVRTQGGAIIELGLLEVFAQADRIVALAETAPPSLVAQYRLLLVILHRALSSQDSQEFRLKGARQYYAKGLPLADIQAYLERWRDRFWLFDTQHPFMQAAILGVAEETCTKQKPWTQISLASANGNTPVVFDHSYDSEPRAISFAECLRTLLGYLQFVPGGLVKTLRDSDKAGPLANTAAILPQGQTLAKTLCLALHSATRQGVEDLPCWEQSPVTLADLRAAPKLATGPNDRYTRLSRAVLLLPEPEGGIRWLRFAAGVALEEDPHLPDSMACFRKGSTGPVRLTFTEGRALWRDLPALVPNPENASHPAAVLNYATRITYDSNLPVLVAGLASDQAKLLRWRAEQLVMPVSLFVDVQQAQLVRDIVKEAEDLFTQIRSLATKMIAEALPDSHNKETFSKARSLFDSGPSAALYFSTAERQLSQVLDLVSQNQDEQAEQLWQQALAQAARSVWGRLLAGMGGSVQALRADALYWPRFCGLLNEHLPEHKVAKEAVAP
ncbi:CRISPR-associated protein, Cse1 family [Azomonas agilis]|uniref:CRISPR-associated protein, Cse1 family n=1 Tax=Azomonas agilis TaxID=116849 RepID=A0A562I1D8_9GAMM|nr:type I-E CRISPR-associated protein Cse1/CasA [Azomonas agilis]TWH64473.1 CRISPR-associated protein, Cse1 family [Azomonas agilis]